MTTTRDLDTARELQLLSRMLGDAAHYVVEDDGELASVLIDQVVKRLPDLRSKAFG